VRRELFEKTDGSPVPTPSEAESPAGLTCDEARRRLEKFGPNMIAEALKKRLAPAALVRRDSAWTTRAAAELDRVYLMLDGRIASSARSGEERYEVVV
jgi:hypothetical protein